MRVSSDNITQLGRDDIFVFGSNLSGIHGAGAAGAARRWGAQIGNPVGLQGQTYAIPTKGRYAQDPLDLDEIREYVDDFIRFAKNHPDLNFLVTEIGCGLAGYYVWEIAPMFRDALPLENVYLPKSFYEFLEENE